MALESYLYREPVEADTVRSLLVRALVNSDGNEEQATLARGLALAYADWLAATADEEATVMDGEPSDYTRDRVTLAGDEADRLFLRTFGAAYARALGQTYDPDAHDAAVPCDVQDVVYEASPGLPKGVIVDVALALGQRAAHEARAFARYMQDHNPNPTD